MSIYCCCGCCSTNIYDDWKNEKRKTKNQKPERVDWMFLPMADSLLMMINDEFFKQEQQQQQQQNNTAVTI